MEILARVDLKNGEKEQFLCSTPDSNTTIALRSLNIDIKDGLIFSHMPFRVIRNVMTQDFEVEYIEGAEPVYSSYAKEVIAGVHCQTKKTFEALINNTHKERLLAEAEPNSKRHQH